MGGGGGSAGVGGPIRQDESLGTLLPNWGDAVESVSATSGQFSPVVCVIEAR
jgi:hypothetical protein